MPAGTTRFAEKPDTPFSEGKSLMDKRSFLAIAVTFVILLAWQILYLGPRQKEVTARRSAAMVEKARADSIAAIEQGGDEPRAEDARADAAGAADTTDGDGTNAATPDSADFFANDGQIFGHGVHHCSTHERVREEIQG